MPRVEHYIVEVTTEVTIKTSSGRIIEEFSSSDEGPATSYLGTSLKGRTEVLLSRTSARVLKHVKTAEVNEKARLSNAD